VAFFLTRFLEEQIVSHSDWDSHCRLERAQGNTSIKYPFPLTQVQIVLFALANTKRAQKEAFRAKTLSRVPFIHLLSLSR